MMIPNDTETLRERLIQLTRDLVLIESTDAKPAERSRCFQFIRNHLESCPGVEITLYQQNGYESLVALPHGIKRASILFCAHLDVVDHPDDHGYVSVVENGRIVGPGAGDMKGQLAILLVLFTQLLRDHPQLAIGLLVTSDEERGGEAGVRFMVDDLGLDCDVAVVPDGGSIAEITVEEKGILHLRVHCEGRSAHAARPWQGDNPMEHLVAGLSRLRAAFDAFQPDEVDPNNPATHWFPTCSLTYVHTPNESINRIPDVAVAALDIRFPPPFTSDDMIRAARDALGPLLRLVPIIQVEPTFLEPDPLFLEITEEVTGETAKLVRASAGSDARFFCAKGIPVLLSRPRVGNLHGHDEWIEIESMLAYYEICKRFVLAKLAVTSVITGSAVSS